ncbi:MAG: hypothetical protein JJ913_08715 [Rhizobiaceae bacterium]|nr:hypothetical protein [Rhizobiaceae bacterium]
MEHVIPESLGNKSHILPKGIVCDRCNNYFSRKVEKPFLESPAVRELRFYQDLENKRGRTPSIGGLIMPDVPATITRYPRHNFTSVELPVDAIGRILRAKEGKLLLPMMGEPPTGPTVSRFVAKVALEAMALRLVAYPEGIAYLCDETQLDDLRDHARIGRIDNWPVSIRKLYSSNAKAFESDGKAVQIVHEFDILVTDQSEWFFVLAIFGVEFALNVGGPDISGYERWLAANNGISLLYTSKYGGTDAMPR